MAKLLNRSDAIVKALLARGEKPVETTSRWKCFTRTSLARRHAGDGSLVKCNTPSHWHVGKNGALRVSTHGTVTNSISVSRPSMEALIAEGRAL